MHEKKYNSNYIKNAKNSKKKIQEIVEVMMAEKVNKKPFDFLFRRNSEAYPKTNHEVLGLPGIFKQIESPNVFTIDGKSLQQDLVESVLPDGKNIMTESTINVEQQAYLVTPEKKEMLYFYKHHNISKHEKPCISVIVTNIDYKTDELICKINGEIFNIKIIYFSPEKINKIINTLSKKDYSKEVMSEADFLNLVHCLIFANKEHAKDVIKKIVDIFVCCEKIQYKHQLDLHLALKIIIKYRFNDEKEVRRFLTMITQAVSEKELDNISGYEILASRCEQLELAKDKLTSDNDKLTSDNNRLTSDNNRLTSDNDQLVQKTKEYEDVIEQKNKEIEELKEKNRILMGK